MRKACGRIDLRERLRARQLERVDQRQAESRIRNPASSIVGRASFLPTRQCESNLFICVPRNHRSLDRGSSLHEDPESSCRDRTAFLTSVLRGYAVPCNMTRATRLFTVCTGERSGNRWNRAGIKCRSKRPDPSRGSRERV